MLRLDSYLLPPLPSFSVSNIVIALLNTRSIVAKLTNINQDEVLLNADIVCFIETWLKHDQNSPFFPDHQVVTGADRIACNTCGGVMIAAQTAIKVSEVVVLPNQNYIGSCYYIIEPT